MTDQAWLKEYYRGLGDDALAAEYGQGVAAQLHTSPDDISHEPTADCNSDSVDDWYQTSAASIRFSQ